MKGSKAALPRGLAKALKRAHAHGTSASRATAATKAHQRALAALAKRGSA